MREHDKTTDKESPPKNLIPVLEKDSTLKLAAVLKKWKKKRDKFKMKVILVVFSLLYLALCSIPVYFAWAERFAFKNELSEGGKVYLTIVMTVVAVCCIYVACYQYRAWVRREKG